MRIEEKRLEEEKLLASEQMRLDEAFNKTHQILTMSEEVETAILPCIQDKAKVLEVLDGFTVIKLKGFIHAHSLKTLNRKGMDFYSLPKLKASAAAVGTKCLILTAYECIHKPVVLLAPSRVVPTPPNEQPPLVVTSTSASVLEPLIAASSSCDATTGAPPSRRTWCSTPPRSASARLKAS